MDTATAGLDELMAQQLPPGGFSVSGVRGLYMEVKDTVTDLVWMSSAPVQPEDFEALELDETLVRIGIARAPMDRAGFQYSPGAPDEPVRERVIDGRHYINVAIPQEMIPPSQPGGPIEISVNKAHIIGFEAGRSLAVMSLPEGDFVEVVGESDGDDALVLPEGAVLKHIELAAPWVVSLPTPTRTFFWFGESLRSFQGPVRLPDSA